MNKKGSIPQSTHEVSLTKLDAQSLADHADVVVAGALAVDLSCDFAPYGAAINSTDPQLHTSNPADITRNVGGVGQNIAMALHYLGSSTRLCSMIADDLAGSTLLEMLTVRGLSVNGIEKIKDGSRTAQYVAFNNTHKDLVLAMADMKILEAHPDFDVLWKPHLDICKPKWLVIDTNWNESMLYKWIKTGKALGAKIAYEPVSVAKSRRLFAVNLECGYNLEIFPNQALNLATPNSLELISMYSAAQEAGLFHKESWKQIMDAIGISTPELQTRLIAVTNHFLVGKGLPQQSLQLLPFIPSIVTKLGEKGVLLTLLLAQGDARLSSSDCAPYILSRSYKDGNIGGVYMRLFPPIEAVPKTHIMSVNGVGDTFLGVLIHGLLKDRAIEDIINIAQKASVMTLKSKEAVSPDIASLVFTKSQQQSG